MKSVFSMLAFLLVKFTLPYSSENAKIQIFLDRKLNLFLINYAQKMQHLWKTCKNKKKCRFFWATCSVERGGQNLQFFCTSKICNIGWLFTIQNDPILQILLVQKNCKYWPPLNTTSSSKKRHFFSFLHVFRKCCIFWA